MDVDGTLTDGGIYYDDNNNEFKKFNVKDGAGIVRLHRTGIKTMILTGRNSVCVERRSKDLQIDYVFQGVSDKLEFLKDFMQTHGFAADEVAYIGDDTNDLPCIKALTWTACPADAVNEVKQTVAYVCSKDGGDGAVREYADYIQKEFLYLTPLVDEENAWYTKARLRAHAGGGIEGCMYTNSKEALLESYKKGIRIIELDATITSDDKVVISHNFMKDVTWGLSSDLPTYKEFMECKICGRFTPMSLEDLIIFLVEHRDLHIVLDHPAKGFLQLTKIINKLLELINEKQLDKNVLDQFIIQVFTIEEHEWLNSLKHFKNLEFYFSAKRDIEGTIDYVVKSKVHTVSINKTRLNKELVTKFSKLGVRVFSPSINEPEEIKAAFDMGIWGITSDFISIEELKNIFGKEQ